MNIREAGFWGRDLLFGRRIHSEVQDVELLNNRSKLATKRRLELLSSQLEYVTANIPFYQRLGNATDLSDFPVLNKQFIRSNQEKMLANDIDLSKLHVASTSGSSGTPFRVYHDREKRQRIDAESIYFGRLAGYEIGNPLWHLKVWTDRNTRSYLGRFARNIHPVDVSSFGDNEALQLIDTLRSQRGNKSLIGYSSSLETMARVLHKEDQGSLEELKVVSIIGQSEPLSQESRVVLAKAFGTYPVGRYGLEEVGIVAQQQSSDAETYRLNLASHVVELLNLSDNERVRKGEVGRVVVTDLFNKAQPLIRYDTGDLAVAGSFETTDGFLDSLARLDGRSRDRLFDVNDQPLTPMIAYNFWWKFPEILQYQIVQYDRGHYALRLEVRGVFDKERELVKDFRDHVGESARIDVEYGLIETHHASGKRKAVVSEYSPRGRSSG